MPGPLAQMVRAKYPGAYDDLDDEQLEKAVTAKYPGVYDDLVETPKPQPPQARGPLSRSTPSDFPVLNLAKGAWNAVKEIPAGVKQMVTDPIGTARMVGEAQGDVGLKAKEAFDRGDYFRATVKGVEYLIPILGPMMSAAGDKMEQGNIAEAIGELGASTLMTAAPFAPKGAPKMRPPKLAGPTNPKDAAAVAFAREQGVPLDLGTATGRQMIKNTQKRVGNTIAGEAPALKLQQGQMDALTRVGGELTGQAGPKATNPLAAGESVRKALTGKIETLHAEATGYYDALRAIEDAEAKALPKSAKTRAQMDVTARTPLAVDITEAAKQLQPLYQQLMRESQLGIPMQGAKGRTLAALDGLMNSPNVASLSVVDGALSDLKALARGASMPELRSTGQAAAARAVQQLDAQVRAAAAKAGPNVLQALEKGRSATKQKYAVAEVLDMLSGEPGQVFRQLTQNKDIGVERLRAVAKHAPQEMPNVARALLEDMMQTATQEGGFAHADKLWANWNKLGGETKKRLFPKEGQTQALDNFFLLAKRIKENPNPSGTAQVLGSPRLNVMEVLAYLPAKAMAQMFYNPQAVRYLTQAQVVAKTPSRAAQTLALTQISKAAQSAGVPMEMIPALTGEPETAMPSGRPR